MIEMGKVQGFRFSVEAKWQAPSSGLRPPSPPEGRRAVDAAHFLGAALDFVFLRIPHRPRGGDGQARALCSVLLCCSVLRF